MALPRMHSDDRMKITPRMTQALQNQTHFKFQALFIIIIIVIMQRLVTHSHIGLCDIALSRFETIVFGVLVTH